jgi:hypothetical protein
MQSSGAAAMANVGLSEGELRILRARLEHLTPGPYALTQPYALWQIHRQRPAEGGEAMHPLDEVATFGRGDDANFFLDAQRLLPRLLADYERLRDMAYGALAQGA